MPYALRQALMIALAVLLFLFGAGAFLFGFVVICRWPDLIRAYAWVGLPAAMGFTYLGVKTLEKRPRRKVV
jgi:hypothetical protein